MPENQQTPEARSKRVSPRVTGWALALTSMAIIAALIMLLAGGVKMLGPALMLVGLATLGSSALAAERRR